MLSGKDDHSPTHGFDFLRAIQRIEEISGLIVSFENKRLPRMTGRWRMI
jgi:hypothetical protein